MTERPRRHVEVPTAPVALDEKGEALAALLPEVLKTFEPEIGADIDEVVVTVKPDQLLEVCRIAKEDRRLAFNYLRCLSVVDYQDRLEIVYHLYSLEKGHKVVIKTSTDPEEPSVPSVVSVWSGADWFEREGRDLFGVIFQGHPNLVPLVLYEDFEGFPGRKSFPFHQYEEW